MTYLEQLQRAFPIDTYANTLLALREGVAAADDVLKGTPLLDNPVGKDLRGLVRRAGVFHRFHDMCKAGDLPFAAEFGPMPIGSWHWLNIVSDGVESHIVRTDEPDAFPLDTPNRQDQRAKNICDLFETETVIRFPTTRLYAWLCYRVTHNGALAHALWQAPSAKADGKADEWLARINILNTTIARVEDIDHKRPAIVDPKTRMKLKDDLAEVSKKKKEE